jgi:hypothetical protein
VEPRNFQGGRSRLGSHSVIILGSLALAAAYYFHGTEINWLKQTLSLLAILYPSLALLASTFIVIRRRPQSTSYLLIAIGGIAWLLLLLAEPVGRLVDRNLLGTTMNELGFWYGPLFLSFLLPVSVLVAYPESSGRKLRWAMGGIASVLLFLTAAAIAIGWPSGYSSTATVSVLLVFILILGLWRAHARLGVVCLLFAAWVSVVIYGWHEILFAGIFYGGGFPILLLALASALSALVLRFSRGAW